MKKLITFISTVTLFSIIMVFAACKNPAKTDYVDNRRVTIVYDANGSTTGTVPVDSNNYKFGDTVTILGNTGNLVRAGYSFDGWNKYKEGYGENYTPGDSMVLYQTEGTLTLYAKWTRRSDTTTENVVITPENIDSVDLSTASGAFTLKAKGDFNTKFATLCNLIKQYSGEIIFDLSEVTGVTRIDDYAFRECAGLKSITIPSGVTSIGDGAFYACTRLSTVTIPDGVTSMGNSVFSGCTELTSVTIPDGVTSIGAGVFYGCTGLTSVTLPDSVINIGISAFNGCTRLASITIPDSVKNIGNFAFSGCTKLTSIRIPPSVLSLGNSVFKGCKGLTVTLRVRLAKEAVFSGCEEFSIILNRGELDASWINDSTFKGWNNLVGITIPEGVTGIGNSAFSGCTGLMSVTIPDGVTSIGAGVFSGCTGLTNITIPESVEHIGASAFYGCTGLTGITLPDNLEGIGNYAFKNCSGLTSITVPTSVIMIGESAFGGCSNLEEVTIPFVGITVDSTDDFTAVFSTKSASLKRVTVGGRICIAEKTLTGFSGFTGIESITILDDVTSIGANAFQGCTGLKSITISNDVSSIGNRAFAGCTGLTSITIPSSVESIGNFAFNGCTALKELIIEDGDSTLSLGYNDYSSSSSSSSIGKGLFYACPLESIYLGRNISYSDGSYYGYSPFSEKNRLASVEIGNSVTSIGRYAFYCCTGLTTITLPDGLTRINSYAFENCTGLTSITLPSSVESIGIYAFNGCSGLESVNYRGNSGQWSAITIDSYNSPLTNANRVYNYTGE